MDSALPFARAKTWLARAILGVGIAGVALYATAAPRPADRAVAAPSRAVPVAARPARPAPLPTPVAPSTPRTDDTLVVRRVLDTGGPIRFGTWFWDDKNVPDGPTIITVDLQAEVLSIFRGGYEIGTAAVIFGADGMPTPLGVFPITQKDAHHVSNLYHAPMPYMLRLTNDGVSIHGSEVAWDAATHGCIGVPTPFAKKLFGATRLGDKVIVTRGRMIGTGQLITA